MRSEFQLNLFDICFAGITNTAASETIINFYFGLGALNNLMPLSKWRPTSSNPGALT